MVLNIEQITSYGCSYEKVSRVCIRRCSSPLLQPWGGDDLSDTFSYISELLAVCFTDNFQRFSKLSSLFFGCECGNPACGNHFVLPLNIQAFLTTG